MKIREFLASLSEGAIACLCLGLVLLIGYADYHTAPALSTSIFYVVPVAISAWYGNRRLSIVITVLSAIVWLATDSLSGTVSAENAPESLRGYLRAAMKSEKWPVAFSIGLVICEKSPHGVQEVVSFADQLMYSVKKSGKNRVALAKLE